jgi:hypothetical protein
MNDGWHEAHCRTRVHEEASVLQQLASCMRST